METSYCLSDQRPTLCAAQWLGHEFRFARAESRTPHAPSVVVICICVMSHMRHVIQRANNQLLNFWICTTIPLPLLMNDVRCWWNDLYANGRNNVSIDVLVVSYTRSLRHTQCPNIDSATNIMSFFFVFLSDVDEWILQFYVQFIFITGGRNTQSLQIMSINEWEKQKMRKKTHKMRCFQTE